MPEQYDVFLSYAHEDYDKARTLQSDLERHNLRVWFDVHRIFTGDNWIRSIETALLGSRTYIFLMSRNALKSEWVSREYAAAVYLSTLRGATRKLIPVLLEDVDQPLPLFLQIAQWADLRDISQREDRVQRLAADIRQGSGAPASLLPEGPTLKLHEFIQLANKDLLISGLSLDKFTSDSDVRQAIRDKCLDRAVKVVLILLNPNSNYAKAHEPFHRFESKDVSARVQIEQSIRQLKHIAAMRDPPSGLSVYLSSYMPRFRAVVIDDAICHVNLYNYGEDVKSTPELVFRSTGERIEALNFASVRDSLQNLLDSPHLIPLISDGWFDRNWPTTEVQYHIAHCLDGCCSEKGHGFVRKAILDGSWPENGAPSAGSLTGTLKSRASDSYVNRQLVTKCFKRLSDSYQGMRKATEIQVVDDVMRLLQDGHARLSSALDEMYVEEVEDVVDRLVLAVALGHPEPLYPQLESAKQVEEGALRVIEWLEQSHKPNLRDWLRLSVAAEAISDQELLNCIESSDKLAECGRELWNLKTEAFCVDASQLFLHIVNTNVHEPMHIVCFPSTRAAGVFTLRFYDRLFGVKRRDDVGRIRLHVVPRDIPVGRYASYRDLYRLLHDTSDPVGRAPRDPFPELRRSLKIVNAARGVVDPDHDRLRLYLYNGGPKRRAVDAGHLPLGLARVFSGALFLDVRGSLSYRSMQNIEQPVFFGFCPSDEIDHHIAGGSRCLVQAYQTPRTRSFEVVPSEKQYQASSWQSRLKTRLRADKERWEGGPVAELEEWTSAERKHRWEVLKNSYSNKAGKFDQLFGNPDEIEKYVEEYLGKLKQCKRVLVIGCGSGREVFKLWKLNPEIGVCGIDFSSEAILLARRHCDERGYPDRKGSFCVADYYAIRHLFDEPFDGVVANAAFVHLLDREDLGGQILQGVCSVLKPGALMFLRLIQKGSLKSEMEKGRPPFDDDSRWFVYYTREDVEDAAKQNHFSVVEASNEPHDNENAREHGVSWVCALLRYNGSGATAASP